MLICLTDRCHFFPGDFEKNLGVRVFEVTALRSLHTVGEEEQRCIIVPIRFREASSMTSGSNIREGPFFTSSDLLD